MQKNVANFERIASVLVGGFALQQTLKTQRSMPARAAAGSIGLSMLWRGLSGSCPVYSKFDIDTTKGYKLKSTAPTLYERSTLVNLPPDEVSSFLRTESNPWGQFIQGSQEFEYQLYLDGKTWTLELSEHADGSRTLIKTRVEQTGPAGSGEEERMLNLRQLKSLLETGEIASIEGQPHGERSSLGAFFENFGDKILQKVQSKTALLGEEASRTEPTSEIKLRKEARA